MTEASIVAICTASGIITTQIVTLIVAMKNDAAARRRAEANAAKQDAIIQKTDVIHELANGNLTNVSEKLDTANRKIEGLHAVITKQAKVRPKPKPKLPK